MKRMKFNADSPNALLVASALCFAGSGFCAGMATGYVVARRSLARQFNDRLTDEVAAVKQYYTDKERAEVLALVRHFESSDSVLDGGARDLVGSGPDHEDDGTSSVGDRGPEEGLDGDDDHEITPDEVHVAEHEQRAMDAQEVTSSGIKDDTPAPDGSKPYGIGVEEFCDPPEGRTQITITYYASDRVLVDDKNDPIRDIVGTVGPISALDFGGISQDPHIRFVRNDRLDVDFEIILNSGSYMEEVLHYGRPNPEE